MATPGLATLWGASDLSFGDVAGENSRWISTVALFFRA